jgi:glycosyltransferase involved in cell wall biosynthesis
MKILVLHRQQSGVGYYRSWIPARALADRGHTVVWREDAPYKKWMVRESGSIEHWVKENVGKFDVIIVDRELKRQDTAYLTGLRHYSPGCRMIVDFDDDFLQVPWWNTASVNFQPGHEYREAGLEHLKLAEVTTVTTDALVERFKPRTHCIRKVPNFIDERDWEGHPVNPERANDPSIRILYGGAAGHYGDLDEVRPGLERFLRNPPVPVRFICIGAAPSWLHELRREKPERVINIDWQSVQAFPQVVAWGGFDLAVAPLADHPFNEAKSNIKWLEAAVQRIPLVCSSVGPYKEIPDGCAIRVENEEDMWYEALCAAVEDAVLREGTRDRAYEAAKDQWGFAQAGPTWEDVITEAMDRPRIVSADDARLPSGK